MTRAAEVSSHAVSPALIALVSGIVWVSSFGG
jgi:hypothetical protein